MKIAIVKSELGIGGISISLINFLEYLDKEYKNIKVDFYTLSNDNNEILPNNTNVIKINNKFLYCSEIGKSDLISRKEYGSFLIKCAEYALLKIIGYRNFYNLIIGNKKVKEKYDYVISYTQDSYGVKFDKFGNQYVLNKFDNTSKVTFLHGDIEKEPVDFDDMEMKYKQFDKIVCVSQANAKSLSEKIPSIKDKIVVEYNHFNKDKIIKQSQEYTPFIKEDGIKYFVTVSRLSEAKGIDRALSIIEELVKQDINNFKWYFVGEGIGEFNSTQLNYYLKEKGLDRCAEFVGNKNNPYPYIAHADFFIFPTRKEACPMVVDESKILGTYIITCEYPAAKEQIKSPNIGYIVNNTRQSLFKKVKDVLISDN